MKLSLRNLFQGLDGSAAAQTSPRPAVKKTRLEVERLEERDVPTANILWYNFPIYNGAQVQTGDLFISTETAGTFTGTFWDFSQGINFGVSGHLKYLGAGWDTMNFSGSGGTFLNYEWVNFNGFVTENSPHWMEGTLSQTHQQWGGGPLGGWQTWSTSTFETSLGRPPIF
jgi:hypothetical protein